MDFATDLTRLYRDARSSGRLDQRFNAWQQRHAALATIRDIDAFVALQRIGGEDPDVRSAELAAVCMEAAQGDDDAMLLLLWLFSRSLRDQVRAIRPAGALCEQDLHSEALIGFWQAVRRVRADSTHVGWALIRQARLRAVRANAREQAYAAAIDPDEVELDQVDAAATGDASQKIARTLISAALAEGIVTSTDAALLLAEPGEVQQLIQQGVVGGANMRRRRRQLYERLRRWISH